MFSRAVRSVSHPNQHLLSSLLSPYYCRNFATAPTRSGVFRQKTIAETWTTDKGAWPVMGTFAIMITFVGSFGLWYMASSPDVRMIGDRRKQFLRGELAHFSRRNDQ